jgi:tether containing UBX domain for GLUT4
MSQEPEQIAEAPAPIELEPAVATPPQPDAAVPEPQNEIKVFSAPVASTSTAETPTEEGESSKPCTSPLFVVLRIRRRKRLRANLEAEINDAYFEPSLSDVQSYHATVISRSKRLNEAPLLTSKHRDEEKAVREKKKAEKWPTVRCSSPRRRVEMEWNEADG